MSISKWTYFFLTSAYPCHRVLKVRIGSSLKNNVIFRKHYTFIHRHRCEYSETLLNSKFCFLRELCLCFIYFHLCLIMSLLSILLIFKVNYHTQYHFLKNILLKLDLSKLYMNYVSLLTELIKMIYARSTYLAYISLCNSYMTICKDKFYWINQKRKHRF